MGTVVHRDKDEVGGLFMMIYKTGAAGGVLLLLFFFSFQHQCQTLQLKISGNYWHSPRNMIRVVEPAIYCVDQSK